MQTNLQTKNYKTLEDLIEPVKNDNLQFKRELNEEMAFHTTQYNGMK